MTFNEFSERFLAALYLETEVEGGEYHRAGNLIEKYNIDSKPNWISRLADKWEHVYFRDVSKSIGSYEAWNFRISADGFDYIEGAYKDVDVIRQFLSTSDKVAVKIVDEVLVEIVPAANRLVRINHNSADFIDLKGGIREASELIRGSNSLTVDGFEKIRLLQSLKAAAELWESDSLKVIQIKVGILMVLEDAGEALKSVGKHVAIALLIDGVKAFFKSHLGIDFDNF